MLLNTETARLDLNQCTSGPGDVDTPTRSACGPNTQIAEALKLLLDDEISSVETADGLILTAVVGVGLAVKAKDDAQEHMISTFNTATVDGDVDTLLAHLPQQP